MIRLKKKLSIIIPVYNEKNTILKSHSIEFTEKDREMISLLYKK